MPTRQHIKKGGKVVKISDIYACAIGVAAPSFRAKTAVFFYFKDSVSRSKENLKKQALIKPSRYGINKV